MRERGISCPGCSWRRTARNQKRAVSLLSAHILLEHSSSPQPRYMQDRARKTLGPEPDDPSIPLAALRAVTQGEPLDEVAADHRIGRDTVLAVAELVGGTEHGVTLACARGEHSDDCDHRCACTCHRDEAIERAARAARNAYDNWLSGWDEQPEYKRQDWRNVARAAVGALAGDAE